VESRTVHGSKPVIAQTFQCEHALLAVNVALLGSETRKVRRPVGV
jgi:hypothetical protein